MYESEKIALVKAMADESDEDVVSAYLKLARMELLRLIYPYDDTVTEVPDRYAHLEVEAAVYKLNKRGAEGETSHGENGISRVYENGGLPDSIIRQITPMCGTTR